VAKKKSIIVTVEDEAVKDIDRLAERLVAKGMTIDRVMPITGVIAGTCTPAKVSMLGKVRGVSAVEEELGARIPESGAE